MSDRLMTERPEQIEIRVMPFTAGAHPALGSPFQILSFPSPRLPELGGVAGADPADRQGDDVMTARPTPERGWFESSRSANDAACVEVRFVAGNVGVRDTKDRSGPTLAFGAAGLPATVARPGPVRPP